jgi:hypothetical protein
MVFFFLLWLRLRMTMSLEQICIVHICRTLATICVRAAVFALLIFPRRRKIWHALVTGIWARSPAFQHSSMNSLSTRSVLCIKWSQTSRCSPSIILHQTHSYGSFLQVQVYSQSWFSYSSARQPCIYHLFATFSSLAQVAVTQRGLNRYI